MIGLSLRHQIRTLKQVCTLGKKGKARDHEVRVFFYSALESGMSMAVVGDQVLPELALTVPVVVFGGLEESVVVWKWSFFKMLRVERFQDVVKVLLHKKERYSSVVVEV